MFLLFNSMKQDDEIVDNYKNIKKIRLAEKYSSDKVEKISVDELKQIILKSGFLDQ